MSKKTLNNWADQLRINIEQTANLEDEYKDKKTGLIYNTRKKQLSNKLLYIKNKILSLGVEHSIVIVTYYETIGTGDINYIYFTGLTEAEAEEIIKLRLPTSFNISAKYISTGIPFK